MQSQFKRLISLAKKTGDSFVILDESEGKSYILLPLEKYEHLVQEASSKAPVIQSAPQEAETEIQLSVIGESEATDGQEAKIVDMSKSLESEPEQGEKYYFEEIQEESEPEDQEEQEEKEPLK